MEKKIQKKNREFKFGNDNEFKDSIKKSDWVRNYQEWVLQENDSDNDIFDEHNPLKKLLKKVKGSET